MVFSPLTRWKDIASFSQHPVWSKAFLWLENQAATAPEGIQELGSPGFFARVMAYSLKDRNQARYEMHRHTIDLQYTIRGAEGIELASASRLEPLHDYVEAKDAEHFRTPGQGFGRVDNIEGHFTILLAGEAHMPQLTVPGFEHVRKVVIKIPSSLVTAG